MTQMIARYSFANYATFKTAFDDDAEDRGNSGLSLLQLWRENDRTAWALFAVSDAPAARDYLQGAAGVFNSQAGVTDTDFHLVETV
ncbi:hypothetical protein GL279_09645 [Paracoccus limosus]|uniref:DUF3303 domain-containing protein n=1 Tax=Paracoccus limosus TaxID=913252 RepID=A0A844H6L6_9RHOB|nr:hypothetical protein [Paracoccus limosus]MTH34861.1 hypothetical protein [Paracoccus limosus]